MACFIAASSLFADTAPVPDARQLAAFEQAFTEAWKAHDVAAIKRLIALDGVPESAAMEAVAKSEKWQEVMCHDGAQRYSVDLIVDQNITLTENKGEATWKAEFIPVAEMFGGEKSHYRKETYQPQQWNGRWYAPNLPFAGMVKISRIATDPKASGSESVEMPTGLSSTGELKLTVFVPVEVGK